MTGHPHQDQMIVGAGKTLEAATGAMILLHGRGGTAQGMLWLTHELHHPEFAYLAPQAGNNTWYPYGFLEPLERNEPYLSSALRAIAELVSQIEAAGIPAGLTGTPSTRTSPWAAASCW